jgi:hypothetical protein
MGEFFRGWRRRVGVVTLLMACVFLAGWVRSGMMNDFLATDRSNATYRLGSYGGILNFIREKSPATFGRFLELSSFEAKGDKHELWAKWISWDGHEVHWQWDCGQFHIGAGTIIGTGTMKTTRVESRILPYWSIVVPLTLISLWLLLSRSRPSTTKNSVEPIPENTV